MKKILIFYIFFYLTTTFAIAEVNNFKKGQLNYLKEFIGTYKDEKIYADKYINQKMKDLFKTEINHLTKNLSVRGPIDFISGNIVISGNAPHQGGSEMGILCINLYNGEISGAIYSNQNIDIYSHEEKYQYLPISIKDTIAVWETNFQYRFNPPSNTKMITSQWSQ